MRDTRISVPSSLPVSSRGVLGTVRSSWDSLFTGVRSGVRFPAGPRSAALLDALSSATPEETTIPGIGVPTVEEYADRFGVAVRDDWIGVLSSLPISSRGVLGTARSNWTSLFSGGRNGEIVPLSRPPISHNSKVTRGVGAAVCWEASLERPPYRPLGFGKPNGEF